MNVKSPTNRVAGADAARIGERRGWAVVVLAGERLEKVRFVSDLRPFVESTRLVAVDIPIGLPGDDGISSDRQGRRLADVEAYGLVGARRNSVFWAPPRTALIQPTYAEARRRFPSLSSQAYHLGARILEVDALVARGAPFIEYHPEVSFRALGGQPLDFAKKTWNGQEERRRILQDAGVALPASLNGEARRLAVDDVFDAAVGAVTAREVAARRGFAVGGSEGTGWQDRGVIWRPIGH
jgi:predicted RNase H-like nuclease